MIGCLPTQAIVFGWKPGLSHTRACASSALLNVPGHSVYDSRVTHNCHKLSDQRSSPHTTADGDRNASTTLKPPRLTSRDEINTRTFYLNGMTRHRQTDRQTQANSATIEARTVKKLQFLSSTFREYFTNTNNLPRILQAYMHDIVLLHQLATYFTGGPREGPIKPWPH